jgi:hypothetical protein
VPAATGKIAKIVQLFELERPRAASVTLKLMAETL